MISLTPNLYQRLQNTLLKCRQFDNDQALRMIFIDVRISAWHDELQEYEDRASRVQGVIYQLLQRKATSTQENALVLLLRVLSDLTASTDTLHQELVILADALVQELEKADQHPARIFICYRRYTEPDEHLAQLLYKELTAQGHEVFIDLTMRVGEQWLESIDQHIKRSDLFILLLSEHSINSEMVRAEALRAYEYRQAQGTPQTLPIRVQYEDMLPYPIQATIGSLQYISWTNNLDTQRILSQVFSAVIGDVSEQAPESPRVDKPKVSIGEDGRIFTKAQEFYVPSPEFDPRVLESLNEPGGTMELSDQLYIRRQTDAQMEKQLIAHRTMTVLRAPRQAGKSSLLIRALQYARKRGGTYVYVDLPAVDSSYLQSLDMFLRYLGEFITSYLSFDNSIVEKCWRGMLGPQDKLTSLLSEILSAANTPIVLALDEADKLIETPFYDSFFGLLRSWHNRGAYDKAWGKLNMVLVISSSLDKINKTKETAALLA